MNDLSEKDRKLLESFKPGEYASLTVLVRIKNLEEFMKILRKSNLDLAIIPRAQAEMDFVTKDGDGEIQQ